MDHTDMARRVLAGERRALARAVTLVESARDDHREQAIAVLENLRIHNRQALRIGLSGTPGVGKSTFIENFGMMLVRHGLKIAVLTIDPSSARSGGSILGDKTRMTRLSREQNAFIRPSPSLSHLGGVSPHTQQVVALCEGAGFDVVLIETVGVGQSETVVAQMADVFVLLLAPAGGDELQGVKRGIMEMADLILVNKADGDLRPIALRTMADYASALRMLRKRAQDPDGFPKAMPVSALDQKGLPQVWDEIQVLATWRKAQGWWDSARADQAVYWFEQDLRNRVLAELQKPQAIQKIAQASDALRQGHIGPSAAATQVYAHLGRDCDC